MSAKKRKKTKKVVKIVETKLLTGERVELSERRIVGYCHCALHRGAITPKLLKCHDCVGKGCFYFEKVEGQYWVDIENHKQEIKKSKDKKREVQMNEQLWQDECQQFADELGYNVKVLSVKRTEQRNRFVIFYISKHDFNDMNRFSRLAKRFGGKYRAKAELRHAKDINGNYATM